MRKLLTLLLFIPLLSIISCSKDDDSDLTPVDKEAKLKIVVDYTGELNSFDETLTLQVVSSKISSLEIEGKEMNKTQPTNEVLWFTKIGSDIMASQTYSTTEKASAITLAIVLTPKVVEAGKTITASIKFYSNDKLIETKQFAGTSDKAHTVTYPFFAQ